MPNSPPQLQPAPLAHLSELPAQGKDNVSQRFCMLGIMHWYRAFLQASPPTAALSPLGMPAVGPEAAGVQEHNCAD